MTTLATDPVFRVYAASAVALGLNLLFLANGTALTRAQAKEVINPEDKKLNAEASVVYDDGNDKTFRYRRAHRNALENIPLFLGTGLLLTLVGTSFTLAAVLFGAFVSARIIHSICYVKGVQPFRTLSFVVGALVQVAILGVLGYGLVRG